MTIVAENLSSLVLSTAGFDDLSLTGPTVDENGVEYAIQALNDEATWGSPVPIDVSVQRWMTDGAIASTQGHENRELSFKVMISAATSSALAAAEAALARRANQPGLLVWTPPEGDPAAPSSVFEVWTWHLDHTLDGLSERRLQRMYAVTMTAKPWARSVGLTMVDAVTTSDSATTVSIDTCDSVTGWTGSPDATPSLASTGEAILEQATAIGGGGLSGNITTSLTRTGASGDLTGMVYLVISATMSGYQRIVSPLVAIIDHVTLDEIAQIGNSYYYALPDGVTSFSTLTITVATYNKNQSVRTLRLSDVQAASDIGVVGSAKQLSRTLDVGGSVKTSGSIQMASADGSTALGTALVYTEVNDGAVFSPSMRQYRSSGNTETADATAVSGFREELVTSGTAQGTITWEIDRAVREATYVAVARIFSTAAVKLSMTLGVGVDGGTGSTSTKASVTFTTANAYQWAVLGAVAMPNQALAAESVLGQVITLGGFSAPSGSMSLDELYLLDVTNGALTLVDCGSAPLLWLDAPDADPIRNRPALYVGTVDDRSDAVAVPGASIISRGDHDLDPQGMALLTVCEADNAVVTASYYHRWHTHAGD